VFFIRKSQRVGSVGTGLLIAGLVAHTASLTVRALATGEPPFLNLYEYMLSLTWSGVVVYLGLEWITKSKVYGLLGVPLICVSAIITNSLSAEPRPVPVALQSMWRVPHIVTATFAYAAFGLAFCMSILYLVRQGVNDKSFWASRLPGLDALDNTIYRTIAFGFLMETLLILTGALWAQKAWARYWGWDNKETWSLITWLVYAAYLHTRLTMGWKGRKSAILAMIGFAVAMFTLFGVNLLGGLHSYAN
jgi:cytochrome c-type biogenesis protein CcsB